MYGTYCKVAPIVKLYVPATQDIHLKRQKYFPELECIDFTIIKIGSLSFLLFLLLHCITQYYA